MADGTLYCAITMSRAGGGRYPGGLFKSTNGGDSWTQINTTQEMPYIYGFDVEPDDQNTIYVANFQMAYDGTQGVYKTTDGGATWTRIFDLGDVFGLRHRPREPRPPLCDDRAGGGLLGATAAST